MRIAKDAFKLAIGVTILLAMQVTHAQTECTEPEAPAIPDGSAVSEQELVSTVAAFKYYQQELIDFRECLTTYEEELGEAITPQQKRRVVRDYNESVETEETLAVELNESIQAYRAANSG
jgi:hypothetical protein